MIQNVVHLSIRSENNELFLQNNLPVEAHFEIDGYVEKQHFRILGRVIYKTFFQC